MASDGNIGKADKNAYRVKTPAATIGIRGTDYEVLITEDRNIHAVVWSGGISLTNELGTLNIGMDSDFSYAQASSNLAPQGKKTIPINLFKHHDVSAIPEQGDDQEASEEFHGDHPDDLIGSNEEYSATNKYDPANYVNLEEVTTYLVLPNGVVIRLPDEVFIGILDFETGEVCVESELTFTLSESGIMVTHGPTGKELGYIIGEGDNEEFIAFTTNPDIYGGVILDESGQVVGFIGENGELVLLNSDPNQTGGVVLTPEGTVAGFIDANGVFTPNEEPVGSAAFLLSNVLSNQQSFGYVARFQNGDTVFVYEDAAGVEKFIPFTAEIGALPPALHPSIEWGKWSEASVIWAEQNGHIAATPQGVATPAIHWIDVIPYDPSSLQARTGAATFSLTQMEGGGFTVSDLGVVDELSLQSASGSMSVNFDNNTLIGGLNFIMEGIIPTNTQQIDINFTGGLDSPVMTSTATVTDSLANVNPMNAVVIGVVTNTADAFGGIVRANNSGLGQATTVGVEGVFIMEE